MNIKFIICLPFFILSIHYQQLFSQGIHTSSNSNPLSKFEAIIGGEWHQKGGFQTFRWGIGKKSVIAENYFMIDGEAEKVSEGIWFWHPGEQRIKGYFTAINMPVSFFDYTLRFTNEGTKSNLSAYDSSGKLTQYIERWVFDNKDQISWTLYSIDGEQKTEVMSGTMTRNKN